jgi:integrase
MAGRLSTMKIKGFTKKGKYGDGNGLYLQVGSRGEKSWLFRFTRRGAAHAMGLGTFATVPLARAREMALDCRRLLAAGSDPMEHRQAERRQQADASGRTFADAARRYLDAHKASWGNAKHAAQWESTLTTYALPRLGERPVDQMTTADVLGVLQPIWQDKPETASRLRGRIEAVLSYAKSLGWRAGENIAGWKDNLADLLPAKSRIVNVQHHAALPFVQMLGFMRQLRQRDGVAARALTFAILTATRTGETLGATWREIDLTTSTWTIPPARMKAGQEHRVPLTAGALAILTELQQGAPDAFVFAGAKPGKPLSDMALTMTLRRMGRSDITVHGFRSTFRDWASEATNHDRQVAEMALAHAIGNEVEAAYRRGDLFAKRVELMKDWAQFIGL